MPTLRTPLKRGNRRHINQAAVDAWQRGEVWGVHKALNMLPVEFSPVPRRFGGYGLPDEKPADDTLIMVSLERYFGLGWRQRAARRTLRHRWRAGSVGQCGLA